MTPGSTSATFAVAEDGAAVPVGTTRAVEPVALADGVVLTELARTDALNAVVYTLEPGASDPQPVHDQDEVYVVVHGSGDVDLDPAAVPVAPGTVLVVPAGTPHRFVTGDDRLVVIAVFAPPLR